MKKIGRIKSDTPKGFRDYFGNEIIQREKLLKIIKKIFLKYGFDPLETSAIEYSASIGDFLPDVERPNGGVFSWEDEEKNNLSLRYDLTGPLARVFSQFKNKLPYPYRRYSIGPVWRNEKPGPGRYRQFYQCDADTVGTSSITADAELSLIISEIFNELNFKNNEFLVKINNRKILNGILEIIDKNIFKPDNKKNLIIMRAIDKFERLGLKGVKLLLTKGREDESGDFTKGADLTEMQADTIVHFLEAKDNSNEKTFDNLKYLVKSSEIGLEGLKELEEIFLFCNTSGKSFENIIFDPTIVRGLGYYTGPVFEAELTKKYLNEKGKIVPIGSVAGGGRYDSLVKRFLGQDVPSTGISIGIDRLLFALNLEKPNEIIEEGPIVVTIMDKKNINICQNMVNELRSSGLRAELYHGNAKKLGKQLSYADSRNSSFAIIFGEEEYESNTVKIKDLKLGREMSKSLKKNDDWKKNPSQISIKKDDLVKEIKKLISIKN